MSCLHTERLPLSLVLLIQKEVSYHLGEFVSELPCDGIDENNVEKVDQTNFVISVGTDHKL